MNIKKILALVISFSLLTSCVNVQTRQRHTIKLNHTDLQIKKQLKNSKITYILYHPNIYPLEDFFVKLKAGAFRESIDKFSFKFKYSNVNEKGLKILIENNIIPAFFQIENTTEKDIDFNYLDILLVTSEGKYKSIHPDKLPNIFKRLNWKAIGVNVYNVLLVVAVTAVLVLIISRGHMPNGVSLPGKNDNIDKKKNIKFFNPINKTHIINYKQLISYPRIIKPGEKFTGLLLFKIDKKPVWSNIELLIDEK